MIKILVIDDEEEIRSALKRVLSREGYVVELAESVDVALNIIQSDDTFSLVISDIMVGGMTGIDFIKNIFDSGKNLPVILITGNPNLSSAESAVRYKAFDYISKPVERSQLLNVVRKAIDSKTQKDIEVEKLKQSEIMQKVLKSQNLDLNRQNAAIVNATSDAIVTIDSHQTIVSANQAAFEMFRYDKPAELIGQSLEVLFIESKYSKYLHQAKTIVMEKKEKNNLNLLDVTLRRQDSSTFFADISICSYILDGDAYFTGVVRDVSQKKIMMEQLIDSERRAFLATVAASIGHEINNSLTAIQGYTEMAMKENADINIKNKALLVTINQTQKLNALTANLLLLGRNKIVSAERNESIEINESITNVLDVFKQTARLKYCQVNWIPNELKLNIPLNQDQFGIFLSNLLLNAADATQNAGIISLSLETKGSEILLHITDNGLGMTKEVMSQIFEPYFTTKELGKGSGLGMFVVKQIADTYGIKILLKSEPNKGTTFTLGFTRGT